MNSSSDSSKPSFRFYWLYVFIYFCQKRWKSKVNKHVSCSWSPSRLECRVKKEWICSLTSVSLSCISVYHISWLCVSTYICVCVFLHTSERVCVCVYACVCVHVCVSACVSCACIVCVYGVWRESTLCNYMHHQVSLHTHHPILPCLQPGPCFVALLSG